MYLLRLPLLFLPGLSLPAAGNWTKANYQARKHAHSGNSPSATTVLTLVIRASTAARTTATYDPFIYFTAMVAKFAKAIALPQVKRPLRTVACWSAWT